MKKRTLLTAGLAFALAATFALAQGPKGPRAGSPGGPGGPAMEARGMRGGGGDFGNFLSPILSRLLEITDAQKEAIRAETQASREAAKPIREQLRAVHEQIGEAVKTGAADSVLDGLANDVGNLSGDLLAISLKSRSKIYNTILTAEQRTKLAEIQAEAKDRRQNRRKPAAPPEAPHAAPNGM